MRKLLIVLLLVMAFAVAGCFLRSPTIEEANCPPEDIVFMVLTPFGPKAIFVEKGFLDEENRDINWMNSEDFDQLQMEGEQGSQPFIEKPSEYDVELDTDTIIIGQK